VLTPLGPPKPMHTRGCTPCLYLEAFAPHKRSNVSLPFAAHHMPCPTSARICRPSPRQMQAEASEERAARTAAERELAETAEVLGAKHGGV
jgi:hypothetical protein